MPTFIMEPPKPPNYGLSELKTENVHQMYSEWYRLEKDSTQVVLEDKTYTVPMLMRVLNFEKYNNQFRKWVKREIAYGGIVLYNNKYYRGKNRKDVIDYSEKELANFV